GGPKPRQSNNSEIGLTKTKALSVQPEPESEHQRNKAPSTLHIIPIGIAKGRQILAFLDPRGGEHRQAGHTGAETAKQVRALPEQPPGEQQQGAVHRMTNPAVEATLD